MNETTEPLEALFMLIKIVTVLSALWAVGTCWASGSFSGLSWLWVLPVSFAGTWLGLGLGLFLFLWICCAVVDMSKPRQEDSKFYRAITYLFEEAALSIVGVKLELTGMEKTPTQGRFMLVSNHIFDLDPLVLHLAFRKSQLAFITKRENCQKFLVGPLMHMTLCQPINRENDREALKTILNCIQILKADKASIAVFPEGYTSMDRLLHPFRSGVFKIAQKANVPIVVCTVRNTYKAFHNILRLKPTTVQIHLLEVIPAQELQGISTTEIAERVHKLMADDLGPELVRQDPQA